MAPPVGGWVFFGETWGGVDVLDAADRNGAIGYRMVDARSLPPGRFDIETMRTLPISGSAGAWSDLTATGRDNVVNGYLVDVRRTWWDMLKWDGGDLPRLPDLWWLRRRAC